MAVANTSYVREHGDILYVGDTRVTLASLIAAWKNEGYTAEELQVGFPVLSLAQVYGAIAYYLDHRQELDQQMRADDQRYQAQQAHDRVADPAFYQRLDARRSQVRSF